ncbi:diacylglycerol kinase [bacterium]|jgi:diacylglycerol kinase|nr:diacylglycerol kinase [bacterium]MDP6571264.1 diacylglycerol kinase family protein [Patescibacteria group bacterium]MDP6756266.1 diacylglycerol kinase family protein [Patescibacteria group bacterium]|tara:strand:+ start:2225 stop:2584 length:360 start_codon:yes stop_codon:yes gene_type:complete
MSIPFIKRFKRAIIGFFSVVTSETNIRFMSVVGVIVLAVAWWFKVSRIELIVLLVIVFSVLILEGINTILERVIDLVEPRYKEVVREIKDGLAGLVLLASIGAAVVGIIIFWPYIIERF